MIEVLLFTLVLIAELVTGYMEELLQYWLLPVIPVSIITSYTPLWGLTLQLLFFCKLCIACSLVVMAGREIKTFEQYWAKWCFLWIIVQEIAIDFLQQCYGKNDAIEKYELYWLAFSLVVVTIDLYHKWNKKQLT